MHSNTKVNKESLNNSLQIDTLKSYNKNNYQKIKSKVQ
jgi:hypothetical protein